VINVTWVCNIISDKIIGLWGGLTPLSPILQLYRGCQLYWWNKPDYPEKNFD